MATILKTKIEEYWSKIENVTLEIVKSIRENENHLLSDDKFKDFFVRTTNLR